MSTYRPGDRVTVQPPYDSPHMACAPHVRIAEVEVGKGGTVYRVTKSTMVSVGRDGVPVLDDDGKPVLMTFGPYRENQLMPGWSDEVNRL